MANTSRGTFDWPWGEKRGPNEADCRLMPFDRGEFDAGFCMNAIFYLGTDDLAPSSLLTLPKEGNDIVLGGPYNRDEPDDSAPEELLFEFPDGMAVQSPAWWCRPFLRTRQVEGLESGLHVHGVTFWKDRVRDFWENQQLEARSPGRRERILGIIRRLNRDDDGYASPIIRHVENPSGLAGRPTKH